MAEDLQDKDLPKEEVERLISEIKRIGTKNFKITPYCMKKMALRDVPEELLWDTFSRFELLRLVSSRKLKFGDVGYDLHYELEEKNEAPRLLLIALCLETKEILNCYIKFRDWRKMIKRPFKHYFGG